MNRRIGLLKNRPTLTKNVNTSEKRPKKASEHIKVRQTLKKSAICQKKPRSVWKSRAIIKSLTIGLPICLRPLPLMSTHGQRQPSSGRFTGLQHRQNSKVVHPTLLSGTLPTDLLNEECLEEFVRQIQKCSNLDAFVFGSPARICYAPKRVRLRALLKRLIDKMDAFGMEPRDVLYETLCASMAYDTENGGDGCFFRIFPDFSAPNFSQAPYILLKESVQHISQGTTGLSCWQASSVLANFFFHPSHFDTFSAVSHVLELGAGCGLAGISFAASNAVAKVTLTDAHPSVLCQLRENVALNFDCAKSKTAAVSVEHLDWTDYERHSLPRDVDLIIASDVVFDRALFCPFAALLRHLLLGESAVGLICCAIRDKSTVELFLGEIEKHGILLRAQFDCRLRNCVSGIRVVQPTGHAQNKSQSYQNPGIPIQAPNHLCLCPNLDNNTGSI
uniref:FAM86 N-terminal domain-containing protein n=1 Tax=Globodera rostochiensis TaxID=31243 RepID=A0A914HNN4_GLORO